MFYPQRVYQDGYVRAFDWDKAAQILLDKQPKRAIAGILENMLQQSSVIWENGQPLEAHTDFKGSSLNGTSVLFVDGELMECWHLLPDNPFVRLIVNQWPMPVVEHFNLEINLR